MAQFNRSQFNTIDWNGPIVSLTTVTYNIGLYIARQNDDTFFPGIYVAIQNSDSYNPGVYVGISNDSIYFLGINVEIPHLLWRQGPYTGYVGLQRYIDFRIVDSFGVPVTGLLITHFNIIFQRNNFNCSDALSLSDHGDGRYTLHYTPSAAGHDFVEVFDPIYNIRIDNSRDILNGVEGGSDWVPSDVVTLDQNYGGPNALLVHGSAPESFTVFVFTRSNWLTEDQDVNFSLNQTPVNHDGTWINPIVVPKPGSYTVVAMKAGVTMILNPDIQV